MAIGIDESREFVPLRIAVLTVSSTRTYDNDTSGDLIAKFIVDSGHSIGARAIVKDHFNELQTQMLVWANRPEIDVIISTGGTGVTRDDLTPEVLASISTRDIPGFGELFRQLSYQEVGTSTIQSRACAALVIDTFVFLLPGSNGAVRLGMEKILIPQLDSRHRPCNFAELLNRVRVREQS